MSNAHAKDIHDCNIFHNELKLYEILIQLPGHSAEKIYLIFLHPA
jgi:hypothetical protein